MKISTDEEDSDNSAADEIVTDSPAANNELKPNSIAMSAVESPELPVSFSPSTIKIRKERGASPSNLYSPSKYTVNSYSVVGFKSSDEKEALIPAAVSNRMYNYPDSYEVPLQLEEKETVT